jgi:hypothetical protein
VHGQELLDYNVKVYLATRSEVKENAAIGEQKSVTGGDPLAARRPRGYNCHTQICGVPFVLRPVCCLHFAHDSC